MRDHRPSNVLTVSSTSARATRPRTTVPPSRPSLAHRQRCIRIVWTGRATGSNGSSTARPSARSAIRTRKPSVARTTRRRLCSSSSATGAVAAPASQKAPSNGLVAKPPLKARRTSCTWIASASRITTPPSPTSTAICPGRGRALRSSMAARVRRPAAPPPRPPLQVRVGFPCAPRHGRLELIH